MEIDRRQPLITETTLKLGDPPIKQGTRYSSLRNLGSEPRGFSFTRENALLIVSVSLGAFVLIVNCISSTREPGVFTKIVGVLDFCLFSIGPIAACAFCCTSPSRSFSQLEVGNEKV